MNERRLPEPIQDVLRRVLKSVTEKREELAKEGSSGAGDIIGDEKDQKSGTGVATRVRRD